MDPEFFTLNLDKLAERDLKSCDQLRKHTLDVTIENKPIERALHLFTIGDEIQRLSVVNSIPDLLIEDQPGCVGRVFPKMQQVLPSGSTEFHVAMSQTIQGIVTNRQIPMDVFVKNFLSSIITSMDNKDPVVANAWSDTLVAIMDYLPVNVLQSDIIPVALGRAELNKSVPVRMSSCRIIGKVISRLDPVVAKKDLIPTVLSLCQDISGDVRACMASQLTIVITRLGAENSRTTILSSLIELNSDEFRPAKEAAYSTTVSVAHLFPADIVKHTFIPLINQMLNTAFKSEEQYIMVVSSNYGTMCVALKPHLQASEKEAYLKWFTIIADSGLHSGTKRDKGRGGALANQNAGDQFVVYRQNSAQNIPKMVQFSWDETNDHLFVTLLPTIEQLISDPFYMVRRTMAYGFIDAVKILGKSSHRLKKEFLSVLRDDSEEVLEGLVPSLSAILLSLLNSGSIKKDTVDSSMVELNRTLIKCEGILSSNHNWRLYTMFLKELEILHHILPSDIIFNSFISLFFKRLMSHRAVPVRLQLIRTILVNLRYLNKVQHRSDVRNKIINDLRMSYNFYDRMIYIRACDTIMELFSTSYFKEYFFYKTITLAEDPVPNIRWGLCRMLPKLKAMCKVASDKKCTSLDAVVSKLSDDKDREVLNLFNSLKSSLERADPAFYFPIDAKLLEEENAMPSDLSKNVETRLSGGLVSNYEEAPPASSSPPVRRAYNAPAPVSRSPSTTSTTTTYPKSSSATNQSSVPVCLNDKEFLVDAGVILSSQSSVLKVVRGSEVVRRLPVRLKEANENTSLPRVASPRQGIPVRQPSNNNHLPPPPPRPPTRHKRHSLEVMDVNKNVSKGEGSSRPSHLPRPLSCINFPPKSDDYSKPRPVSRLPVLRQRM